MPVLAIVFNCEGVDARNRKTGFYFVTVNQQHHNDDEDTQPYFNTTFQLSS